MECGGKRSATPLWSAAALHYGVRWQAKRDTAVECGGIAAALDGVVLMGMDCGGDSAKGPEATGGGSAACQSAAAGGALHMGGHPMSAPKKRLSPSATSAPLYHLKVSLEGIEPLIWRRLQVPGDANLGWLHAVIQVAMGWTNSHLHQFNAGKRLYSDPSFGLDEFEDDPCVLDENKTAVLDIVRRAKSAFVYEYDFGDSWEHRITVERILEPDPAAVRFAQCLDGERACPPEDCGGVWGYENLLKIIRKPKHKEYESMMEWLGGKFNPEAFDRDKINKYLRKLKWARTTVSQLAGVLMQRDRIKR